MLHPPSTTTSSAPEVSAMRPRGIRSRRLTMAAGGTLSKRKASRLRHERGLRPARRRGLGPASGGAWTGVVASMAVDEDAPEVPYADALDGQGTDHRGRVRPSIPRSRDR